MKPTVKYVPKNHSKIKVGARVCLIPLNHYSDVVTGDGKTYALTSPVVRVGEDGEFETQNTIYVPSAQTGESK